MSTPLLDDRMVERLIESSIDILNDAGYFTQCLWHVNDIHLLCEQRGWPVLTHQEARSVFAIFAELYEGDQGLTWAKLEQATQVYLAQQGKIKQMQTRRSLSFEAIQDLVESGDLPYEVSALETLPKEFAHLETKSKSQNA